MAALIKCPFFGPVRSSLAFDRGGQTGPPRSNDFFFGAADDTCAAQTSGQTSGRTPGRTSSRTSSQTSGRTPGPTPHPLMRLTLFEWSNLQGRALVLAIGLFLADCCLLFLIMDLKSRYQEKAFLDKPRPAGQLSAAPVSSAALKKKII